MSDTSEDTTPNSNLELGDALSPQQAAFLLSIGMIDKATAARAFGFPDGFVSTTSQQEDGDA